MPDPDDGEETEDELSGLPPPVQDWVRSGDVARAVEQSYREYPQFQEWRHTDPSDTMFVPNDHANHLFPEDSQKTWFLTDEAIYNGLPSERWTWALDYIGTHEGFRYYGQVVVGVNSRTWQMEYAVWVEVLEGRRGWIKSRQHRLMRRAQWRHEEWAALLRD